MEVLATACSVGSVALQLPHSKLSPWKAYTGPTGFLEQADHYLDEGFKLLEKYQETIDGQDLKQLMREYTRTKDKLVKAKDIQSSSGQKRNLKSYLANRQEAKSLKKTSVQLFGKVLSASQASRERILRSRAGITTAASSVVSLVVPPPADSTDQSGRQGDPFADPRPQSIPMQILGPPPS